jgi:phosphoglycerate dehydrogenase-like enzyme
MRYLTTLDVDDAWLDALAKACPSLEIRRHRADSAEDVPADVWAQTEILHTGYVLPDPASVPRLRWIQLDTSGVEHVRAHPIWSSGVEITTLGGIAPVPMAEFVIASVLDLAHHAPAVAALRRRRAWPSPAERLASLTPLPVDGATLTVVGYGRIGREVARIAHTLGLAVVALSRRGPRAEEPDIHFDTGRPFEHAAQVEHLPVSALPEVLARTDYLVVVVPLTPETAGLLGERELGRIKPGSCVVNVSRGGVVDETALLAALDAGRVRYAAMDVFDDEPLPADSPWWEHDQVLVTPHIAGLAPRYSEQVLDLVCTNVLRIEEGRPLLNRADRAAGY